MAIYKPIIFNTPAVRAILDGDKTIFRRVIMPQPSPYDSFVSLSNDMAITKVDKDGEEYPESVSGLWATFESSGIPEFPVYKCPWEVGYILWVREAWNYGYEESYVAYDSDGFAYDDWRFQEENPGKKSTQIIDKDRNISIPVTWGNWWYKANKFDDTRMGELRACWKSPVSMPKGACRLFLRVTDIRVERLQDITDTDAQKEGVSYELASECGYEKWYPSYYDPDSGGYPDWKEAFGMTWDETNKHRKNGAYAWDKNPWVWVISFERTEKPESWPVA